MRNYNYAIRRYNRHVKAMRRLREDRAEHGGYDPGPGPFHIVCDCFLMEDKATNGKTYSRFADYPALNRGIDGNPRRVESGKWKLTRQERRAPSVSEWD